MKSIGLSLWLVGAFAALNLVGCGSDGSCQDEGTCLLSSGAAAGSSGSTSTTTSGSGSTGTMVGPEDCTNGVDDDLDGKTDCQDDECLDKYTCIPPIPAGFSEVVTIAVTPFGEPTVACGGGAMPTLFYQNPAVDACDACTCDASGVTCTPGQLATSFSFDMTCTNPQPAGMFAPNQCKQVFGGAAILQTGPTMTGQCQTTTSSGPPKPAMETTIATCPVGGTDGGGCGMTGVCVPSEGLATAEHLCIKRPGHEVCPGDWPLALYAFESFVDDRTGCTPCGCSVTCEGGKYTIHPNDKGTCDMPGTPVDTVGQCVTTGGSFSASVKMSAISATCTTTGGQMMGSVKPMNETTFCCF